MLTSWFLKMVFEAVEFFRRKITFKHACFVGKKKLACKVQFTKGFIFSVDKEIGLKYKKLAEVQHSIS